MKASISVEEKKELLREAMKRGDIIEVFSLLDGGISFTVSELLEIREALDKKISQMEPGSVSEELLMARELTNKDIMAALPPEGQAQLKALDARRAKNAELMDRVHRLLDNKSDTEAGMAIMNASAEDWLAMRAVLGNDHCNQLAAGVLKQWGKDSGLPGNAGEASARMLSNRLEATNRDTLEAMFGQNVDDVIALGRLAQVVADSRAYANPQGAEVKTSRSFLAWLNKFIPF